MRLLLDMGNTRLKWALQGDSPAWLARGAMEWPEEVAVHGLSEAWMDLPRPAAVFAASVVDSEREAAVAAVVEQLYGCAPIWLRTPATACGVRNAYAEPHRLGVDRFLAMVVARAEGMAPCVLASAGTALTLDALAADGQHLGGLIAPGARLMQQSLVGATARVRPEQSGQIVDLADNTADAVTSGCWQALAALVERFAARAAHRLGASPLLILDGGDAERLLPLLSLPARMSVDGVLRGLALWADTQMAPSSSV
jgi:type III pantothenate kinase